MRTDRWEYKCEELKPGFLFRNMVAEKITDTLNREGAQGWELVNVVTFGAGVKVFYKRQR